MDLIATSYACRRFVQFGGKDAKSCAVNGERLSWWKAAVNCAVLPIVKLTKASALVYSMVAARRGRHTCDHGNKKHLLSAMTASVFSWSETVSSLSSVPKPGDGRADIPPGGFRVTVYRRHPPAAGPRCDPARSFFLPAGCRPISSGRFWSDTVRQFHKPTRQTA